MSEKGFSQILLWFSGATADERKPGSVMVEFDDGDRGWISSSNIRFLPPGYQIECRSHIL